MRNRWLINVALLVLVISLGALMRRELDQERSGANLTGLSPESITEISIERPNEPPINLFRDAEGWGMKSPYQVRAAAARIEALVRIAETQVLRSLPRSAGTERLGVKEDGLRLTLNGLALHFGDVDPVEQHRYVAIGEQVHLIGDGFYHHLTASAEDYVERTLLPRDFLIGSGTLDGAPLSNAQLTELEGLAAQTVEPLGSELIGQVLSLTSADGGQSLRFLVSADGLDWARLDLRLRYLLAAPPAWSIVETAAGSGDQAEAQELDVEKTPQ
jgi:hypothetical protein